MKADLANSTTNTLINGNIIDFATDSCSVKTTALESCLWRLTNSSRNEGGRLQAFPAQIRQRNVSERDANNTIVWVNAM
jgi:hypothetical protein